MPGARGCDAVARGLGATLELLVDMDAKKLNIANANYPGKTKILYLTSGSVEAPLIRGCGPGPDPGFAPIGVNWDGGREEETFFVERLRATARALWPGVEPLLEGEPDLKIGTLFSDGTWQRFDSDSNPPHQPRDNQKNP